MRPQVEKVLELTRHLISLPSVTGDEQLAVDWMKQLFTKWGWEYETIAVTDNRENLFVSFGTPEIVFTTHLDVVPAPDTLFVPRLEGDRLYGRGACDAKGIAATMLVTARELQEQGADNFGILFVVGEEVSGDGARKAATVLKNRGIEYIINGEPTEGKVLVAHKGDYIFEIECEGKACHSGYPALGNDANQRLASLVSDLYTTPWGEHEVLGDATLNVGLFSGGVAMNVVSPRASATCYIRTVEPSDIVARRVLESVGDRAEVRETWRADPSFLTEVPGFEYGVAAYSTDIPNFRELGAQAVLYGPGTIHVAHTGDEHITASAIAEALVGYEKIFRHLHSKLHPEGL